VTTVFSKKSTLCYNKRGVLLGALRASAVDVVFHALPMSWVALSACQRLSLAGCSGLQHPAAQPYSTPAPAYLPDAVNQQWTGQ
jgi:hypothetical protein